MSGERGEVAPSVVVETIRSHRILHYQLTLREKRLTPLWLHGRGGKTQWGQCMPFFSPQ
jgi:hypothetical protein